MNEAFDRYFDHLPKRQQKAWKQTYGARLAADCTDPEARVDAWRSIGVSAIPNGAESIPVMLLLRKEP